MDESPDSENSIQAQRPKHIGGDMNPEDMRKVSLPKQPKHPPIDHDSLTAAEAENTAFK